MIISVPLACNLSVIFLWVSIVSVISFFVFMTFKGSRDQAVSPLPELNDEEKQRVRRARESSSKKEKE